MSRPRRRASSNAAQHVGRAAAGRQAERDVARAPERGELRANTTSKPTSLDSAVTTAMSAVSENAGSGRPAAAGAGTSSATVLRVGAAAAVAEREQPAAGGEPVGHRLRARSEPRAVVGPARRGAARRSQRPSRRSSGAPAASTASRSAWPVGVQERIQRGHRVRRVELPVRVRDAVTRAPTAMRLLGVHQRSRRRRPASHQRDADLLHVPVAGVDESPDRRRAAAIDPSPATAWSEQVMQTSS